MPASASDNPPLAGVPDRPEVDPRAAWTEVAGDPVAEAVVFPTLVPVVNDNGLLTLGRGWNPLDVVMGAAP